MTRSKQAMQKALSKSAVSKKGIKTPFDALAERRRKRTFLLRLNDQEMVELDELATIHNVSRSNVVRMALKHAHTETVEAPLRKKAESEIAREAALRAVDARIEDFKQELLESARGRAKDTDGAGRT